MNTTKRYIAILILICTLLSTISFASDVQNDVNVDENITLENLDIDYNDAELMPMAANSCGRTDYNFVYGAEFNNTAAGLKYIGVPFSGSGLGILLISPLFDLSQEQRGTDLCVFLKSKSNSDNIVSWYKVKKW